MYAVADYGKCDNHIRFALIKDSDSIAVCPIIKVCINVTYGFSAYGDIKIVAHDVADDLKFLSLHITVKFRFYELEFLFDLLFL